MPPQLPTHCHPPLERVRFSPVEQPVALHAPFTDGEAVQLALVALPQLPAQPHRNVADPVRQLAVFDTVTLVPPGVALKEPEQPLPQRSVVAGQGDPHGCVRLVGGLLAGAQGAPPQLGWTQMTLRLWLCSQRPLED